MSQITINAQGQITNAASVTIAAGGSGTVTNVATGTGLTGGPITSAGTIALANTAVTAGIYGNSTTVAQVTFNAQGQATLAANVAIASATLGNTALVHGATTSSVGNLTLNNATVTSGTISNVTFSNGTVNGTSIGATTASTGAFTTLSATSNMTYGGVTLSNSVTGTGSMVLSASPTLSGTVGGNLTFSGTHTLSSALTYGGVTLSNSVTGTGNMVLSASPTFTGTVGSAAQTITSTSANSLAVGANGTTNPVLNIDASTASVATGLNVKGAAAASGLALSVTSSGTNENLTIDAKGSGTITVAGTSTGIVSVGRALLIGATSVSANAEKLNVTGGTIYNNSTGSGTTGIVFASSGTAKGWVGLYPIAVGSGGTANDLVIRFDGNQVLFVAAGSPVANINTSGVYTATSDARLVDIMPEQTNYRDLIKSVWLGDVRWKRDGKHSLKMLAQDLYSKTLDGLGAMKPAEEDGVWGIEQQFPGYLALWGVKDLYAEVETLKAELAKLKERVN